MTEQNKGHPQRAPRGSITASLFQKTMLTLLVAELSVSICAIVDAILVGRYLGAAALAAVGLGSPFFSVVSIVSGLLMVGCLNLCTNAVGLGDMKRLSGVFTLTLTIAVAVSVLLALFGVCFTGRVAVLFGAGGASAELFDMTCAYMKGLFPCAPAFILFVILTPLLQLDGDGSLPKLAGMVCTFVDIVGDLLSIFVFRGGMLGIGLASSASQYAALTVALLHFLKKGSMFRFSLREVSLRTLPPLLRDGLPRAVCMLCRALLPILLNVLLIRLVGDMGVTAFSTEIGASFALAALGWGIGGAVLMMGGMMVGEQNDTDLKIVVKTALADILIGVTALAALAFALSPAIAALFIPEAGALRDMAADALRCYALSLPFLAFNVASANYFQTLTRNMGAHLINIGIEVAAPAAVAYLLGPLLGAMGVWLAFPVGQALLSLLIVLRLLLSRDASREGLAAYMLLGPDFGVAEEDCIERSIQTMDEVIALSSEVSGFCAAHGFDEKRTNHLALCIEEMAGNVIEHGFCDGRPHRLDLRILAKDGKLVLRLRDDCALFDLKEKAEKWAPDPAHPERNMGIRMIMSAAESIVYSGAMNTNNLIVTI